MNDILIGRNDATAVELDPHFGNRHGMISAVRDMNVASQTRETR